MRVRLEFSEVFLSIWILLWLVLSAALLYFLGWTLFITHRQKQVWRSYASKNKLRYRAKSLGASPEMTGPVGKYSVSLFTGEHVSPDARGSRKLTAVEVLLLSKLPMIGGIASAGMVEVIQGLGLQEEVGPNHKGWDKSYIAASDNRAALEAYLTPERLEVLTKLMKVKNAWVIFVFKEDTTLLRFDTPDPLYDHKKLDLIIKKMIEAAKVLELKDGESARLKTAITRKPKKQATIKVGDEELETGGLQLEDDEGGENKPSEEVVVDEPEDGEKPSTEKS